MKYYLLFLLFLLPILLFSQDVKYDHLEVTLRVGGVQRGGFYDPASTIMSGLDLFNKPQGSTFMTSKLAAEIAVTKTARSLDKTTRWTYGLKFGATPSKISYFYPDSFFDSSVPQPTQFIITDQNIKLKLGTQYFGGVTGGFRTRLFRIKEAWLDWQLDVGVTLASSKKISTGYDPLFNIEGDINGSGNIFFDLTHGLRFNMPVKGRMIGISGAVTFSRHETYNYNITYFGHSETITEQLNLRHVFPAFGLHYYLVKSSAE